MLETDVDPLQDAEVVRVLDVDGPGVTLEVSDTLGVNENDLLGVGDFVIDGVAVAETELETEIEAVLEAVSDVDVDGDPDMVGVTDTDEPLDGVMLGVRLLAGVTEIVRVTVLVLVCDDEPVKDGVGVTVLEPTRHRPKKAEPTGTGVQER